VQARTGGADAGRLTVAGMMMHRRSSDAAMFSNRWGG
jgi:hypothetical protein